MAETIGRVEFIVGLDGKRLTAEARRVGKELAAAGADAGDQYGKGFGEEAGYAIDTSLNRATQRAQLKFAKAGTLAGKTYAGHIDDEAMRIFRRMEKKTIAALSSKEGFEAFAKNFDSVDEAVKKLEKNVKRLSKQKITFLDKNDIEQTVKFFQNFEAGPAMQQVDKWAGKMRKVEVATVAVREANVKLRDSFAQLKGSVDNRSFDDLAERLGGAAFAAIHLEDKMQDLADAGGVTDREFHAFNATLEKHVERHEDLARKTQDTIDKQHVLALQMNVARDRTHALDQAMAHLNSRMGDRGAFERYVEQVGDLNQAHHNLRQSIALMSVDFDLTEKQTEALMRKLDGYTITLENNAAAATQAAGRTQHLAVQQNEARTETDLLDRAMAALHSRMGNATVYRQYVEQVGDHANANRNLTTQIRVVAGRFRLGARAVQGLTNSLAGLSAGFERTAEAAARAAAGLGGGGDGGGLFGRLRNFLGARGGLSVGAMIALVASAIEPAMVAIQGLGAALSSVIGIVGAGLAGAAAIGSAGLVGLIWTISHATAALDMMEKEFPPAKAGMDALAEAAKADSAAFARAWGPALAEFTETLAKLWRDDKMGERAGEALGKVTAAFTDVLNSPAYRNFQTAMETTIPNAIANLGGAAASLTGGLLNIWAAAGPSLERVTGLLATFAETWATKIQGQMDSGELGKTIDGLVDDFLLLLDTVKEVWDATTQFFDEGRESGRKLLEMIGENFDTWSDWMSSVEGEKALDDFFDSGIQLADDLFGLLPDLQKGFEKVVTPEARDRLSGLIDEIGTFVSGPGAELVQMIGELDVFGTLASVFNDLLTPLKPLFDILTPIFGVVSGILEIFGRWAGVILTVLAPAFIPFRLAWEALNTIIEQFLIWSEPLFTAFEEIGTAISEGADAIWKGLQPAIEDLYGAFLTLLPSPEELARIIREDVIPSIQEIVSWITDKFIPKLSELIGWISDVIEEHGGWEGIMAAVETAMDNLKIWIENDGAKMFDILMVFLEVAITGWEALESAINFVKTALGGIKFTFDQFYRWFSGIPKWLSDLIGALSVLPALMGGATAARNSGGGGGGGGRGGVITARGGIFDTPQIRLISEAGAEAVVPLRRPLSAVDPSVRALSAVAQGKAPTLPGVSTPAAAGKVVNINAGAVQITGDLAPETTATTVVNRLAQRIAG